jgi:hypothetical protein
MTRLVSFTGTGLETASLAVGRPGPFLTSSSVSKALTCCNLEISASKCSMIVAVFMNPPSFILNDNERWPVGFMMTSSVAPFFAAWVRRTLICGLAPISCAIAHPAPEAWGIGNSINANSPQGHMLRCEAERCALPWLSSLVRFAGGRAHDGYRWTGGAITLLILCLPQQLRNYDRCANLGHADPHRRGAGGNVSVFAPSVPLSGLPTFHGPFPRSERRISDTLRSTIRRRSTAAVSATNVVCSVFSSGHAFHCIARALRRESCPLWSNQSVR